jgi:hypothetical protein
MASDLTTMAHIYKRRYIGRKVEEITVRDHPRFKRLRKKGGFTGTDAAYHILTGNPQSIGGSFANNQTNVETSKGKQPVATRREKTSVVQLAHVAILASQGDDGAFYDLVTRETDGVFIEFGDRLAFDAYRDGSGQRGRISAISTNVITLTVSDDVRNFKEGMTLIADDTANGTSPRSGTAKVAGVSGSTTITLDNAAGISGLAVNDYLFVQGDPGTCMEGLATCTPLTEPTAGDSFRGIDRSVNVPRLSGSRVNDTNSTIEENLGLGAIRCNQLGVQHTPTEAYLNPINFFQVARRQGAKVMYTSDVTRAKIGFQYIDIVTATGTMKVFSDPDCPTTLGYGENPEWDYIHHLGGFPHVVMNGKEPMLAMSSALAFESRGAAFCNYFQENPAAHFVIAI